MSLSRLSPSLRIPLAQRTRVSPFSSSASRWSTETADAFFNQLSPAPTAKDPLATTGSDPVANDGPPTAQEGSYTPSPAARNPLRGPSVLRAERPVYAVSVKASRNNTIVTFAKDNGNPLVTLSGGKLGFKKSNRNGYEAGYQCAVGIIAAMEKEMLLVDYDWALYLSGFGQGRDAMLTAITTTVGEKVKERLHRITDRTPLKIGGTRGQKTRRV